MFFNKSAIIATVCAALAPCASAATVSYKAFPNTTVPLSCLGNPSSTGTFQTGTTGAPGCHNLTPAAYYGEFTLGVSGPLGCHLNYFAAPNCMGPAHLSTAVLAPGAQSLCTSLQSLNTSPPSPTVPAQSLQVVCP